MKKLKKTTDQKLIQLFKDLNIYPRLASDTQQQFRYKLAMMAKVAKKFYTDTRIYN